MEGLDQQEKAYFESGGTTEVEDGSAEAVEAVDEVSKPEVETKTEVAKEEKKRPSKFDYSPDTDNVTDDLGRKYVPLGAIQEARNENKTLRKQLEELEGKWKGGEEKLNKLLSRFEPKDETPAYDKDPLGHLSAKNKALEEKIAALEAGQGKIQKETEASSQIQQFTSKVTAAEKQFASQKPDYAEAVGKVQEIWRAEFEEAGLEAEQIEVALSRKGAQFSYAAMQKGQNPAEAVYKLAQRLGHKSEKKDEPNKDKQKLAQIAKGQEAEKSLASGKGNSDLSLEALASMSDEDMEEFVADPKNWKKLSRAA